MIDRQNVPALVWSATGNTLPAGGGLDGVSDVCPVRWIPVPVAAKPSLLAHNSIPA
jgi:hypothetical protein